MSTKIDPKLLDLAVDVRRGKARLADQTPLTKAQLKTVFAKHEPQMLAHARAQAETQREPRYTTSPKITHRFRLV